MPRLLSEHLASYGERYAVAKIPPLMIPAWSVEIYEHTPPGWSLVRRYIRWPSGLYGVLVRNPVRRRD